jgi:hypothetical protein
LKLLIDSAAGYRIDRRAELEAVVTVARATLSALMRAYMRLPVREDDHLRVGAIIARVGQPGYVERARQELTALGES